MENPNIPKQNKNITEVYTGGFNNSFLSDSVNELLTYKTPKSVVDFINRSIFISNPSFKNDRDIQQLQDR